MWQVNQTQVQIETKTNLKRILFHCDLNWKMFNFQKSTINMKWDRKKKTKTRKTQLTELNRTEMIDIHLQMKKTDEIHKKISCWVEHDEFFGTSFFVFSFLLFHFFCFPSTKDIRRENQSDLQSDSHLLWKSNFNLNVKSLETFRLKIYLILFWSSKFTSLETFTLKIYLILFWSSNVKSLKHFPRSMVYLLNFNWKLKR
jgi:hypothetical protein